MELAWFCMSYQKKLRVKYATILLPLFNSFGIRLKLQRPTVMLDNSCAELCNIGLGQSLKIYIWTLLIKYLNIRSFGVCNASLNLYLRFICL